MRRSEKIHDIYDVRRLDPEERDRAKDALKQVLADIAAFEAFPPTDAAGVDLKAREAVRILSVGDDEQDRLAASLIREFFQNRKTVDTAWMRDLRYHVEMVSILAPGHIYVLACLRSILVGMGRPRLVK